MNYPHLKALEVLLTEFWVENSSGRGHIQWESGDVDRQGDVLMQVKTELSLYRPEKKLTPHEE